MEEREVVDWLTKRNGRDSEWYHIHSVYEGTHKRRDGSLVPVTITARQHRYANAPYEGPFAFSIEVVTKDGKRTTSKPADSPLTCLQSVDWDSLG
jgi:hypothetical protein